MDAIRRLALEGPECCRFSRLITDTSSLASQEGGEDQEAGDIETQVESSIPENSLDSLNQSQREAVNRTMRAQVSLIWGPPGRATFAILSVSATD